MIIEPNCHKRKCIHFLGVDQPDGTEATERVICKAFPKGIPDEIAYGPNVHGDIEKGQKGNYVYKHV